MTSEVFSFSNTIVRLRLPKNTADDPHYISTFLNCKYGYEQSLRLVSGGIQGHVMPNPFKTLSVSVPDRCVQKYIGEKIRQSEWLRVWAKNRSLQLIEFEGVIPVKKPSDSPAPYNSVRFQYLTSNRLDAKYYRVRHLTLESQFDGGFEKLGTITESFRYGASVEADYVCTNGVTFIRGNALSANSINANEIVLLSRAKFDEVAGNLLVLGDVLITRSGTVGVAAYVDPDYVGAAFGSFVIRCRLKALEYRPEYVSWYLNSWVGQQQFRRLENGAVQLNINLEELASVNIWKASFEQQDEIAALIIGERLALSLSRKLTESAKLLVESLIEGQVTESQLIDAQRALDAGDDTLDRAILARLKTDGLDGEGEPLFPDLDQLYGLLERAKPQTEA